MSTSVEYDVEPAYQEQVEAFATFTFALGY
jgi:hypothetical protein